MIPDMVLDDLEECDVNIPTKTYRNGGLDAPVAELRKTELGKEILREQGRKDKNVYRSSDGMRPFNFWDGEGVTTEDGVHHYILFGAESGHLIQGEHLTTIPCLNLMLECETDNPEAYHVGFAFKYDVEMILRDVGESFMVQLHKNNVVHWCGYRIEYYPGKWFQVSKKKVSCKIWDLFGFFQQSFVSALRALFGEHKDFDEILAGKDSRSGFQYNQLETLIKPYWKNELRWGNKVAERLRELLYAADLRITWWHGPGAVASFLMKKHGIAQYKNDAIQSEVADAAQYAFTAGRFEAFRLGRANCKVYVTDINSAHPSGMAELPSLTGEWYRVNRPGEHSNIGIYLVSFDAFGGQEPLYDQRLLFPQPISHRDNHSLVSFPAQVKNWIWYPELRALQKHGVMTGKLRIHYGYELDYNPNVKPFEHIYDLYEKRQHYKSIGEHVQMAYKLALNSEFGKTAQRVGWKEKEGKIPQWHQLEWAGMITSNTRALLWGAIMEAAQKGSLISVDTDAVFSTVPLNLPMSNKIGEWDYKVYDDMVYLQNGIYWLLKDGKWKQKFRGLDPDSLTVDDALRWFAKTDLAVPNPYTVVCNAIAEGKNYQRPRGGDPQLYEWEHLKVEGRTTRFIGSKAAFAGDGSKRCKWMTEPRIVHVGTEGKRLHFRERCKACQQGLSGADSFHELTLPAHRPHNGEIMSKPHFIPWRLMTEGAAPWADMQDEMFYS
jgi:hypothetical protein